MSAPSEWAQAEALRLLPYGSGDDEPHVRQARREDLARALDAAREQGRRVGTEEEQRGDVAVRRHYATRLGILDPDDSTPCWDDIVDAAREQGRREERARCIAVARGCIDYSGGYRDEAGLSAFHHGIKTVANALSDDPSSTQVRVLESIGKSGEHIAAGRNE